MPVKLIFPYICMWQARSRHTSGRDVLRRYGNVRYVFVEEGNALTYRCLPIVIVATWRKLRWILEQPSDSCLSDLPRFQWMLSVVEADGTIEKNPYKFTTNKKDR